MQLPPTIIFFTNEQKSFICEKLATINSKTQNFPPPRGPARSGSDNFVSAEYPDKQITKVAETTDANNSQDLARATGMILQEKCAVAPGD